jgi:hypothetical protein
MPEEPINDPPPSAANSSQLKQVLDQLRSRLRAYVIVEGCAVVAIWLISLFLVGLAIDYLPVLVGLTELPKPLRIFFLIVMTVGTTYWFAKLIVSRLRVAVSDRSLALLIERYHDQFEESLVTTVELQGRLEDGTHQELYDQARKSAEQAVKQIDLGRIFNRKRLSLQVAIALALAIVVGGIAVWKPDAMSLGIERLLLLQDKPWPRNSQIEVVGVRVIQELPNPVLQNQSTLLPFANREIKAAKGSNLVLMVRAQGPNEKRPQLKIPSRCIIYYRTKSGERGYQYMARVGAVADGTQLFEFDGQPFRGLTEDLVFDVRGDDHRLNGFEIDIVDSPSVVTAEAACEFPAYMVDEDSGSWTPRVLNMESGLRLPTGSQMTLQFNANKPLNRAWVFDPVTKETRSFDALAGATTFDVPLPPLADNLLLEVTLEDVDGVTSEVPYRAEVLAFNDEAPKINSRLVGIGDAITPDAVVTFQGTIEDDFGVAQAWIEIQPTDTDPLQEPIQISRTSDLNSAIDFRDKRQDRESGFQLSTEEGSKVRLSISAEDRYDLGDEPNLGQGDSFELEVVTPSQLLRRLERKEASQRRLLEQIYSELTDAHNLLVRARGDSTGQSDFGEPGDEPSTEPGDENLADLGNAEVRLVFAQRSWLQLQKSKQEIQAIAATFDNIRLQLINNRVESEDRKQRLQERIIEPLQTLLENRFALADDKILQVQQAIEERLKTTGRLDDPEMGELTNSAIEEMQLLLVDLDNILQEMLKFESYNELLDVVRELIKTQESLLEETDKERKRQAFEDILK